MQKLAYINFQLQQSCKKWIWNFWNHLSKNEELQLLPEMVSAIELNEKNTESILTKLTSKFPKSTRVLRAYAEFLEDIKHDPEQAQQVYRTADEIEDDKRKHKKIRVPHTPREKKGHEKPKNTTDSDSVRNCLHLIVRETSLTQQANILMLAGKWKSLQRRSKKIVLLLIYLGKGNIT